MKASQPNPGELLERARAAALRPEQAVQKMLRERKMSRAALTDALTAYKEAHDAISEILKLTANQKEDPNEQ